MAIVQMQLVRVHRGSEGVVYAVDFDLASHREYEDALQSFEAIRRPDEFTRTVGEGSPLRVGISGNQEADHEELS